MPKQFATNFTSVNPMNEIIVAKALVIWEKKIAMLLDLFLQPLYCMFDSVQIQYLYNVHDILLDETKIMLIERYFPNIFLVPVHIQVSYLIFFNYK